MFSLNAILSSFDRTNFIDSCAEFSVANRCQFERMKDVRELAPHEKFSYEPTKLHCDNAAAVMHVQSPIRKFSPRTKSLDMKTKYIVELVHHNVLEIIHVPGVDNPADMMTKPSTLAMIEKFYPILHHANQGVTGGAV